MDKRAVSLPVDPALLNEARALNISLSATFEAGLRDAVRKRRAEQWREENRAALEDYNAWVAQNGLPLEQSSPQPPSFREGSRRLPSSPDVAFS